MSEAEVKLATAYLRRSAATKDNPGNDSRDAQLAAVTRLCGRDVTVYEDWGVSGRGDGSKRPDYQRLRSDIAAGRVASVCAYSLSRLGRNARELLSFIELCKDNGVSVRTSSESIDTTTAMGRAMVGIMAVFAELELETGMERSAAARAVRKARYDEAGVVMPGSVAPYGYRFEVAAGITRIVRDESIDLEPIATAYREAGSILGACALLEDRGVPAPRGGSRWSTSALTRVVAREWPEMLPRRVTDGIRVPSGRTSLWTKLVRCPFCHRLMTPNTVRGQLYCSRGPIERDRHPRYVASAVAVRAFAEAEAARLVPPGDRLEGEDTKTLLAAIEEDRRRLGIAFRARSLNDAEFEAESRALDAREADIEATAGTVEIADSIDFDEDPVLVNEALRALWRWIELDESMHPIRAEWVRSEWRAA